MFDQLYTLSDGQCVYQGSTTQLVPFLSTLNLECPSYHNPASYIIEVACGEHGDHTKKLMNAIENGRKDIRTKSDFDNLKNRYDVAKVHNLKTNLDKNVATNITEKFADNPNTNGSNLLQTTINDIAKDPKSMYFNLIKIINYFFQININKFSCFSFRWCFNSIGK